MTQRRQSSLHTGTCKRFYSERGFGFIEPSDGTEDIFVHQSQLKCRGYRTLKTNEFVEFRIAYGNDGRRKAVNVTGKNGSYLDSNNNNNYNNYNNKNSYNNNNYNNYNNYNNNNYSNNNYNNNNYNNNNYNNNNSKSSNNNNNTIHPNFVYKEFIGDLFESGNKTSLGHCVSRDLHMSKGIASIFKKLFGGVNTLKNQNRRVGECAVLEDNKNKRYIYYLITKERYFNKPTYETLKDSLLYCKKHIKNNNVKLLSLPKIGCGLDRLSWNTVSDIIKQVFSDLPLTIHIYELKS